MSILNYQFFKKKTSIMKEIQVQIEDLKNSYRWRLAYGNQDGWETSEWTSYYEGILKHTFSNGETWYYASDYWNGVLPTEKPFQISFNESYDNIVIKK